MFRVRWQLLRMMGVPIFVVANGLTILVLFTVILTQSFPALVQYFLPTAPTELELHKFVLMGLITSVGFFVSIVLHEFGHAIVGRFVGIPGHGAMLYLFGGVAEIEDEPPTAGSEFLMAIAGPIVSLDLALFFGLLVLLGDAWGWPAATVIVFGFIGAQNGLLLAFSLIPAFPFDGNRIVRAMLWRATGNLRRATFWAVGVGQCFSGLLVVAGGAQFFFGNWLMASGTALIGLFLYEASRGGYLQTLYCEALQCASVRQLMSTQPIVVPSNLDLRHWVDDFVYRFHRKSFPVVAQDHLTGVVTTHELSQVPAAEWDRYTVDDVMRHDLDALTIAPDTDALQALRKMRRSGATRLLVTENDQLVGIVSLKDLERFLALKLEVVAGNTLGFHSTLETRNLGWGLAESKLGTDPS